MYTFEITLLCLNGKEITHMVYAKNFEEAEKKAEKERERIEEKTNFVWTVNYIGICRKSKECDIQSDF